MDTPQKETRPYRRLLQLGYTFNSPRIATAWLPLKDPNEVLCFSDQGKFKVNLLTGKAVKLLSVQIG